LNAFVDAACSYPERIKKLKLPTIAHRRIRGDMIETYKIINEKYDPEASSQMCLSKDSSSSIKTPMSFSSFTLLNSCPINYMYASGHKSHVNKIKSYNGK
jgi:hypothetical protein